MFVTRLGKYATTCLTAAALLVTSVAPAFAKPPGAESPEALVERMKRAAENENMAEMMACLSPEGRSEMAQMMYLMSTMMVGFAMMGAEMATDMGSAMAEGMSEAMGEEVSAEQQAEMAAAKQEALAEVGQLLEAYNAMVSKYGLPPLEEGEEPPDEDVDEVFRDIDHAAFVADVIGFLESMPGEDKPPTETPTPFAAGVMTDLAIDGDAATAKVDGQEVKFIRIDDRWYFDEQIFDAAGEP